MITADFIKPGGVVVDVGMNRLTDRAAAIKIYGEDSPKLADFEKKGSVLLGDLILKLGDVLLDSR